MLTGVVVLNINLILNSFENQVWDTECGKDGKHGHISTLNIVLIPTNAISAFMQQLAEYDDAHEQVWPRYANT